MSKIAHWVPTDSSEMEEEQVEMKVLKVKWWSVCVLPCATIKANVITTSSTPSICTMCFVKKKTSELRWTSEFLWPNSISSEEGGGLPSDQRQEVSHLKSLHFHSFTQ